LWAPLQPKNLAIELSLGPRRGIFFSDAEDPRPPLSLVSPEATSLAPPRKLGACGTHLWSRIQAEFAIADAGGIELLTQACAALDRAEALAEAIARDGEVVRTRAGVPKSHPSIKDETVLRAFVVRTLERLGVTTEAAKPVGRPPRASGWSPDE
jgi:hypothetical protein